MTPPVHRLEPTPKAHIIDRIGAFVLMGAVHVTLVIPLFWILVVLRGCAAVVEWIFDQLSAFTDRMERIFKS